MDIQTSMKGKQRHSLRPDVHRVHAGDTENVGDTDVNYLSNRFPKFGHSAAAPSWGSYGVPEENTRFEILPARYTRDFIYITSHSSFSNPSRLQMHKSYSIQHVTLELIILNEHGYSEIRPTSVKVKEIRPEAIITLTEPQPTSVKVKEACPEAIITLTKPQLVYDRDMPGLLWSAKQSWTLDSICE
ncbi:hypothetical protein T265_15179, partial [Opisthorchis viverrini]